MFCHAGATETPETGLVFKWPTAVLHYCSWNKADPAKALPSRGNGRMGVVDGARIGMHTTMLRHLTPKSETPKGRI